MDMTEIVYALETAVLERSEDKIFPMNDTFGLTHTNLDELEELRDIVVCLCKGDYLTALQQKTPQHLLHAAAVTTDNDQLMKEILLLQENQCSPVRHALVLFTGVVCLDLFIQCNWTGPIPSLASVLPQSGQECSNQQIIARLSQDGESFTTPLMDAPLLFLTAKAILVECEESLTVCQSACIWALRCLTIQRQLLDEQNELMKNKVFHLMDKVQERTTFLSVERNRSVATQIHLELGYLYLYYYDTTKAREHFMEAQSNLGLQVEITGALGKRTKFQETDFAQPLLLVQREGDISGILTDESTERINQQNLPRDVALDDDTLLNKIQFKDVNAQQYSQTVLSALDQAVILGLTFEHKKSQAVSKLNKEKLLAYLEVITSRPKAWCIHMTALLMRSRLEKESSRRVERSMMQLEALVESIEKTSPKVTERQMLFYCVPLPPKWTFQRDLAQLLLGLGVVKSAVEIFQKLHSWEDLAVCYQTLGWYAKAETLIRDQLKIKETALLWCLLGDTLKDASCYEKAWELSGHRNARAQRSLGYLYLRAKEYAKSIPCFQKALELNSLQHGVWFSLGCAAMVTGDFQLASKAFHRCVSLDSENGEAWNNLSNVYIKTGQKVRAHLALKEGLKANYDSWHMWENFLVVSVDVGGFSDAISAYHRLMDLRDKYCDTEVLGILVKAVNEGILDNQDQPASVLKPKMLKLMGRLTSQVTNNFEVWKLYSDLSRNGESPEDKEKALNFLVKAHRTRTQAPGWENDVSQFKAVIELTVQLSQMYVEVSQCKENKAESVQLLSSAKLSLKQLITRVKKHHTDPLTGQIHVELSQSVKDLEDSLQRTVDLISNIKS